MKQKGMDFKHKEVISIRSGRRLGFVQDVCADLETGAILQLLYQVEKNWRVYLIWEKKLKSNGNKSGVLERMLF